MQSTSLHVRKLKEISSEGIEKQGENFYLPEYGIMWPVEANLKGRMMATKTKTIRGKCPNCCPDGGAEFKLEYDYDIDKIVKCCCNCGHKLPFRLVKPTGKITPSQRKVIDRITSAFGGTHEATLMGRKVWLSGKNYEDRNFITGDSYYGTIGPGGAFEITLQTIGNGVKITDDIGIKVYLTTVKKGDG